ncbi:hypothetical protein, partial [Burkholderia gladioli]|uniref:hypothetical protein n=2 Tax=Burkholderia gladioli TaxID=28095 RepID=UPI001ABBCFA2
LFQNPDDLAFRESGRLHAKFPVDPAARKFYLEHPLILGGTTMPDEQLAELRDRYPKQERNALEQKWGFTGLIQSLSTSGDPAFSGFRGLAHGYSVSSHIAHADYIGASIPMDRDFRHAERSKGAHLTHLARLLSDSCTCLYLRLVVGYRFVGEDLQPISEAGRRMDELCAPFGPIYQEWLNREYAGELGD